MLAQCVLLGVLMLFSAFFSASETSLTAMNTIKLTAMLNDGRKGAKDVERLVRDKAKLLNAVLIGNNCANVAISTIAAAMAIRFVKNGEGGVALGLVTLLVTFVIVIFCEIMPKTLAVRKTEQVACFVALPMRVLVAVFAPVSKFVDIIVSGLFFLMRVKRTDENPIVTEAEIKAMVDVSHSEGLIRHDERVMLDNVLELDEAKAKDIMTPRTGIAAVEAGSAYQKVLKAFGDDRYSRLLVYRDNIDSVTGVLHLKDIVFLSNKEKQTFKASKYMRKPFLSYENKSADALLREMRERSAPVAVILDEYGGTSGIVTMEDLLERIVGKLYDEYDVDEKEIEHINDGEYSVEGSAKIDDFNDLAGANIVSDDYESIGGYALGLFGRIPETGETVDDGEFVFTVEEAERNKIERLKVRRIAVN